MALGLPQATIAVAASMRYIYIYMAVGRAEKQRGFQCVEVLRRDGPLVYIYIYMHMYMHTYKHVYVCINIYMCMYGCM